MKLDGYWALHKRGGKVTLKRLKRGESITVGYTIRDLWVNGIMISGDDVRIRWVKSVEYRPFLGDLDLKVELKE